MNNQNLAHQWSNKTKTSGKGSNMFFRGDTVYSYGDHFPIAKHYINKNRGNLILFTARDYSTTTAKHKGQVLCAIPSNLLYVTVPQVSIMYPENKANEAHQFNMDYLIELTSKNIEKAGRAVSTGDIYLNQIDRLCRDYDVYTAYFKPRMNAKQRKFKKAIENNTLISQELKDKIALSLSKKAARDEAARIKRIAKQAEDLRAWQAGADIRAYFEKTCLRVKDGFVETSRGARVSLTAGRLAFKALKEGQLTAGYDIEGFKVISVDVVLKIGCHVIPMEEIKRIGTQLV